MERLQSLWNFKLITLSSGESISVGQAFSVVTFVILGLILASWLARSLSRWLRRKGLDPNAIQTIVRLTYWIVLVLVVITAIGMLNVPIAHFAFIGGAVAVGIGFGAQNIINNLISSWILMSEKPVRIGDFVEVDQYMGTVERIGNRSTCIRRTDGVHILVPNSQMLEKLVVNWTLVDRNFRTSVRVGVAYGSPVRRVAELLLEASSSQADVLPEPKPLVVFEDFGESTLVFDVFFWCDSRGRELRAIRSDVRFTIERLFRENGITIAFPQRDLHLASGQPLEVRVVHDSGAAQ